VTSSPRVALCRRLARLSRAQLAGSYAACGTVATVLYEWGGGDRPLARTIGVLITMAAFSLLFTVVTWYRTDAVPSAAFLLALATTLSFVAGYDITLLFVTPHTQTASLMALGALFGLPIRILVLALLFAVLVSIGRRLRRYFAPDTMRDVSD
jgi:hypothetical protein